MSRCSTAPSRCAMSQREIRDDSSAAIATVRTLPPLDPPRIAGESGDGAPSCHEKPERPVDASRVHVMSRRQLQDCRRWRGAFASQHKDRRYYEIVEDTIHPEIDYWYFAIRNH